MNVWIVQLLMISLIQLPVDIVHSAEETCYRGDLYDYDNPCFGDPGQPEKLDLCPAGQKLAERCTERCEFCEPGTFSDSFNNCFNCKPCLTECPKGQVITQQCNPYRDAVCACPPQECTTTPPVTCEPCPVVTQCPAVPKQTDEPVTRSEPGAPLVFTRNCPPDIKTWTDDNKTNKSVSWNEPKATPGSTIVHQSYKPGHYFPIGHFEAAYVFANNSGVTIACSFSISVAAPVSTTGQPLCDPPEGHLLLCVVAVISGVVITIVALILLWLLCYCKKSPFLKRVCPHHQEKAYKVEDNNGERANLLNRGRNAGGNGDCVIQNDCTHIQQDQVSGGRENHRGAAGTLAEADGSRGDNQDHGTEMGALNETDEETEPENNHQNGPSSLSEVGQTNGQQQDQVTVQDVTQQSPSTSYSSGQHVVLPLENSFGMSPDTPSQLELSSNQDGGEPIKNSTSTSHDTPSPLEPSSNQVGGEPDFVTNTSPRSLRAAGSTSLPPYENVATTLKNPVVDVSDEDIEMLADIVANNERYYQRKDTFLRYFVGYTEMNKIAETLEKSDRNTQLVHYLHRGWLQVTRFRKRSDLAAIIRKFDTSLEQEFIRRINEQEEFIRCINEQNES